ncbi:hypothetical protein BGZ73_007981, partial [Actinomortierella ambigua]
AVHALLDLTHSWVIALCPGRERMLYWPSTPELPLIIIHIHSVVFYSFWRTLMATHKLEESHPLKGCRADDILWLTVSSLKLRARTALFQVVLLPGSFERPEHLRQVQRPYAQLQSLQVDERDMTLHSAHCGD